MKLPLILILSISALVWAQDKDIRTGGAPGAAIALPDKPDPPAGISAELRAKYWRSQNELNVAETAAVKARDKAREMVTELSKACGANLPVKLDEAGEPVCTPNPPIPAPGKSPEK